MVECVLHVGFGKTGSSALQAHLCRHPELDTPPTCERAFDLVVTQDVFKHIVDIDALMSLKPAVGSAGGRDAPRAAEPRGTG